MLYDLPVALAVAVGRSAGRLGRRRRRGGGGGRAVLPGAGKGLTGPVVLFQAGPAAAVRPPPGAGLLKTNASVLLYFYITKIFKMFYFVQLIWKKIVKKRRTAT